MFEGFLNRYYALGGSLCYGEGKLRRAFQEAIAPALKALRAAEWGGTSGSCPVCYTSYDSPHFEDCLLKKALDALEGRP